MKKVAAAILAIALVSCAGARPELQTRIQTVEVDRPVNAPCPQREHLPAKPRRVAEEHPAMPRSAGGEIDWQAVSRILGAKVLELFGYADQADGIMQACSRPAPALAASLQGH